MLNIAVVGMGGIGNRHAGCYRHNPHTQVVAVCDALREKAEQAGREYDCPAFPSVEALVGSGIRIDAASVCTAGEENGGRFCSPKRAPMPRDVVCGRIRAPAAFSSPTKSITDW